MKGVIALKLGYDTKSKDPTYYIQQGIRNGKKVTTRNIVRIGKHSELLKITDDPLAYARQKVKEYNEKIKNDKVDMTFTVDFNEKISPSRDIASRSSALNIGYFVLQSIYHDLKLNDFFNNITADRKITFDCNIINRFLTYARILDPKSKLGTFDDMSTYYEQPDIPYHHMLRFMDVLAENYDSYISHLFEQSNNVIKRDNSVCYFDCTNYYFEIEHEDDDYIDEVTGEVFEGIRKYGPSKQHQPAPLVQMGLFMDKQGIPISMCISSGSTNEQKCVIPLEEKMVKMFRNKKFIYCADAGLGCEDIRVFNDTSDRAFIITQSVKKLSDALKDSVFSDIDYKLLSNDSSISLEEMKSFDKTDKDNINLYNDFAYKVLRADKDIDIGLYEEKTLKNGKTRKVKSKAVLKQYVIVTYSRKAAEYQKHIRDAQVERARKLLKRSKPEDIKKGPNDIRRFIKRNGASQDESYMIDEERIASEAKYDGFYAVATNLEGSAKEILEINSKRYKIEDCFRVLKTHFNARPVHHRLENRITAHFMICYTALLIYRLLEVKLDRYGTHYTTDEILKTLKNMNVVNNKDVFYQAIYNGSDVCSALNGVFDLGLDRRYYLPKDLNKKIKKISK